MSSPYPAMTDIPAAERLRQIIEQVQRNAGKATGIPIVPTSTRPTPRRIYLAYRRVAERFTITYAEAREVLAARADNGHDIITTSYVILAENSRRTNLY